MAKKYRMKISRTTVDKLGIKLYDRPSACVAELVANAHDADAETVTVELPLARWLATRQAGKTVDHGLEIRVTDDGHGMTADEVNDAYLMVGSDRRTDPKRGNLSRHKKRKVMGHKGIGKLAPFGICKRIHVITAGGKLTSKGYRVSHFILDYHDILASTDKPYYPEIGPNDETWAPKSGTTIVLTDFQPKITPDLETFHRQMAARFGLRLPDFAIQVKDTETGAELNVGDLPVDVREGTRFKVDPVKGVLNEEGKKVQESVIKTEFGETLALKGWCGLSIRPYKNTELAGIRIYARGKIVSTVRDFGIDAGFTGEHTIRSYLIGELHADWLDDDEDLVRTDRQDILWDSDRGEALQDWGQALIRTVGGQTVAARRESAAAVFVKLSNIEEVAKAHFPEPEMQARAVELAKTLGGTASLDDLDDQEFVKDLTQLVVAVAPHHFLLESLRDVDVKGNALSAIAAMLSQARVAEIASMGQVAYDRIKTIDRLEEIVDSKQEERYFQKVIEDAPWLIHPEWTVLAQNQPLEDLRRTFEKWYKDNYGEEILTRVIDDPTRKPDFVMLSIDRQIAIVEIKAADHKFDKHDMERLDRYIQALDKFLADNPVYAKEFGDSPKVILVADEVNLKGVDKTAYAGLVGSGRLEKRTWREFLHLTKKRHEKFLEARGKAVRGAKKS